MGQVPVIEQFFAHSPPFYRGHFNGKSLTIKLDSSAILKLGSESTDSDPIAALSAKRHEVAIAAQRLIELRQFDQSSEELIVIVSALDFD